MQKSSSEWMSDYVVRQQRALESIDLNAVQEIVEVLRHAHQLGKQVFVFGNGGNAASASHFATDLGKGASDQLHKPFRVMSLNDNVPWLTALGNDYSYADVFVRQLRNFAQPGDVVISSSVSGSSENLVKALQWCRENQVTTVAVIGAKNGKMGQFADHLIVVGDTHYGRVEDAQMTIYHMLCYAFMELPNMRVEH
ncbi:MAG: SIS domain-containing protein [Planctomyces sp.]|nr:SIS domain-containing protein [Planctomyces sp.]